MILAQLFFEFFKIGLFAIGGGMATLPFLYHLSEATGWFPVSLISDMVAISESTPGPIGINMATYVGYSVGGLPGGVIASVGVTVPSVIIVILVSKSLQRFNSNPLVKDAFYGLRPAVTALIAAAGVSVMEQSFLKLSAFLSSMNPMVLFDWKKLAYFVVVYIAIVKLNKHPIAYIAISAVVGILLMF